MFWCSAIGSSGARHKVRRDLPNMAKTSVSDRNNRLKIVAPYRTDGPSLRTIALSLVLAIWALYALFGNVKTDFDAVTLSRQTRLVFATLQGQRVQCADLEDADDCLKPAATRELKQFVLWLGNSQLFAINQFEAGQQPAPGLVAETLRAHSMEALTFSQSNASLAEHFVLFTALKARRKPNVFVLPLVFDDTRESSLRYGIARAINDPAIKRALLTSSVGRRIVSLIESEQARTKRGDRTTQERSEDLITGLLEKCCRWETLREEARGQIGVALYRTRNSIFGIRPSSLRRKIPAAYEMNLAALEEMLKSAKEDGIKVLTYIVPLRSDDPAPTCRKSTPAPPSAIRNRFPRT